MKLFGLRRKTRKSKPTSKPRIYKGTDADAFKKASVEKTPKKRSERYYEEKAKKEKAKSNPFSSTNNYNVHSLSHTPTRTSLRATTKRSSQSKSFNQPKRCGVEFRYKKTIIDDLRNYRNSRFVSKACDVFAIAVVKTTGKSLSNTEQNILRSTISFVASEVFNKVFEEEKEFIEKVKLYIKIGKFIYKVISWIDEKTNEIRMAETVERVPFETLGYKAFLSKYPSVNAYYKLTETCLSKDEILSGRRCLKSSLLADKNTEKNKKEEAPNFCEYYNYCHGIEKSEE